MLVALTRPRADSERLAAELAPAGIDTVISPVLEIVIEPPEGFDPAGHQAVLLTSRNGAEALAESTVLRTLRILAVGDATAERARQLGFAEVESADGDADALIALAVDRLAPADGPVMHARGRETRGNVSPRLSEHGFDIESVVLYRAEPVAELEAAMQRALTDGRLDGVLAFSPRSMGRFADLVAAAGLAESLRPVVLYAMSAAVAEAAARLPWGKVVIAAAPTQEALLETVAAAAATNTGTTDMTSKKDTPEDQEPAAGGAAPWEKTAPDDEQLAAEDTPTSTDDDAAFDEAATAEAEGYADESDIPDAPLRDPAAEQPTRRRWPYVLVALIVFFVAGLVAWPFVVPRVAAYLPDSIASRLTGNQLGDRLGDMDRRLAAFDTRLGAVESADADRDATVAATRKRWGVRLETLETGLAQGHPARAGLADRIDKTDARLDQLSSRLAAASDGAAVGERLDRLTARLEALEAAPVAAASGGDGSAAAAALQLLSARLNDLEKALADKSAGGDTDAQLARLTEEIGGLKQALTGLSDGTAAQGERLAKLEASTVAGQGEARSAGLAVALSQLRVASRGAAPFEDELAAVKAFGADDPELAALSAPAASGVATIGDLRVQFAGLADDIVQAARLPADDGWMSRTVARLGQLVRVRRTGKVTGDATDAIVARVELRLAAGDLVAAVGEVKRLDGASATLAADWLKGAQARLAVDRTTAELQARLLAALGGSGN